MTVFCKDCRWKSGISLFGWQCEHPDNTVLIDFAAVDLVCGPSHKRLFCNEARVEWRKRPGLFSKGIRQPCGPSGKLFEPVAVPTSGDTVGPCVQNLSSHTGSVAAAGDNTVSNLVGLHGQRKSALPQQTAEPVTHRDLSQHAEHGITDLNCFAPFHGA